MDAFQNSEGPALLQLHRWDHSQVQLDLSEYREAFISPTRELLVLLSYHCEALLLPLVRGNAFRINDDTDRSENQQILLGSSAPSKSVPSTLKSMYHGSSSVDSPQPNTSHTVDSLQQFLPDVNSLAWGVCEDGYSQQKESPFRELLFVCGNRGVTVHAFGHFDGSDTVHESECGEWMEWRPSTAPLPHAVTRLGDNNRSGEIGSQMVSDSKKWMRSFFTRAETKESDGIIRTWFPVNSVLPHSTRIVSFSLFDDASSIFYLLSDENTGSYATERGRAILEPIAAEIGHRSGASIDKSISSKCSKVFSSSSNNFVGFVFDLFDSALNSSVDANVNSLGKMVRVVKLDSFGIQWLCSVRLQETTMNADATWTDFQFTNGLLVCLNASGLISFHEVMTGELVVCLEVTKIYGCKGQLKAHRQEEMLVDGNLIQGVHSTKNEFGGSQLTPQNGDTAHIRKSCRLIVVPNTSFLAVVDEYGSVYVICGSDHVPKKHFSYEELLLQYRRIGALAPWDVANTDISEQKVSATSLGLDERLTASKRLSLLDDAGRAELQTVGKWSLQGMVNENDLRLSGFSDSFQKHVKDIDQFGCPKIARNVFLPVMKARKDDTICFSSIGVTRLMPRDNKKGRRIFHIVHTNLLIERTVCNDRCLNSTNDIYDFHLQVEITGGKAISCIFQGCLYLVTRDGLSVVLPRISISPDLRSVDAIGCQASSISPTTAHPSGIIFAAEKHREVWSNWKVEILDRVLLYEAPDEADLLSLGNGWGIKLSRLRRLQLALDYLKFDEMEQSIAMLTRVNMAEEGVLRLIFAAVYMMFHRIGKENEVSAASRILSLAARVATKLIREYAMRERNRNEEAVQGQTGMKILLLSMSTLEVKLETCRIEEMAHLLEIIRNLQHRLSTKYRRMGQVSEGKEPNSVEKNLLLEDSQVLAVTSKETLIEEHNQKELALLPMESGYEEHALVPAESSGLGEKFYSEMKDTVSFLPQEIPRKKDVQVQNPKEMIARWEIDNLELKDVVKDALFSGRLPLAVLQLHLYRLKDLAKDKEPNDTFNEVRDVGRAIAYDLFLKGEIGLAVETLQKLGEDIEDNLKQLFFGTLSRPLRNQMAEVMVKYGYIGANELAILERISLIERIYPSCSFWRSYELCKEKAMRESMNLLDPSAICLLHQHSFGNFAINCGEVDGVVLGPWANLDSSFSCSDLGKVGDEGGRYAGYWAAAAIWSNGWERKTIDRILLDQSSFMGADLLWESQLDYHMCHNDWEEVYKLANIIPSFLLASGSLQVSLDGMQSTSFVGSSMEFPDYDGYAVSSKELDTVCFDVPEIKILQSATHFLCSTWLRKLMEKELAKRFIFLKEYYQEITEIISLLAQSGFIAGEAEVSSQEASLYSLYVPDFVGTSESPDRDTKLAFHRLLIHYCIKYNLPYLLDLYLDHHKLALSDDSLKLFLDAAGDCQWAKWLLFSRAKGQEYEASFYNARAIAFSRSRAGSGLASPGTDEIIHTVDDIAEGGWLMAALATLMFAPFPSQNCLSHGSVNRRVSSSAQCTFENLKPVLQQFPTLWRMLLGVSLAQDTTFNFRGSKVSNVLGTSALSMYLNWRENIFVSSGHDSSLVQLLPFWFPKSVRKMIRLFVQGPLGWQTMTDIPADGAYMAGDIYLFGNEDEYSEISPIAWEAALQKQIEQELCASSVKEAGYGLEHHLHRGRALAAFKQFLEFRIEKLKSDHPRNGQHETNAVREQAVAQADVQALLAEIKLDEEQLLASVIPLAIANYQNLVVVTSCAFLLELCGLSTSMLRVDIAALRRISDFYKDNENIGQNKQLSPKLASVYDSSEECGVADSLARALADNYLHQDSRITKQETSVPPARVLAIVLQHLEKASLPVTSDANTCGSWLSSGSGDGSELRSRQKASSQHWSLVTAFCQMHQIPLSTKYLAWLARDNDWVGFLSEAQIGGYTLDTATQVAAKEFRDPRLKTHILTVLRGMRSRSKVSLPSSSEGSESTRLSVQNFYAPVELFGVLADCEKQKQPGNSLLVKAKQLSWSILAIIASCFPDVSPFACLTVWLEITDARDASLANANEVASQIANRTAAAVEATNSVPTSDGMIAHHYNRKNPKRRRLMDPMPADLSASPVFDPESSCVGAHDAEHDAESRDCARPIEGCASLPNLVAMLCEQQQFLPLLRAFEMFLPSCSLLPFIRALQAFSQMRLSEASAHLGSFSVRIKEEHNLVPSISEKSLADALWVASTATKAADAMLSSCPSPYERRSLLQLLAATDFGDGGSTATYYRQQYWKINLAEPALRNDDLHLGDDILDDAALLTALETNGHWEQARNWSKQLEARGGSWKSVVHHVTKTQAENMVAEWKEFLWDVPEERVALWGHCQTLFIRYSFPALQSGLFFLKHAEAVEEDIPPRELHELLLLSMQWLCGMITQSNPVYPLHLLREIETRVWLLAVESEAEMTSETDFSLRSSFNDRITGNDANIIDKTANIVSKMDNHINAMKSRTSEKADLKDSNLLKISPIWDAIIVPTAGSTKSKRRARVYGSTRRSVMDATDRSTNVEDSSSSLSNFGSELQDESANIEATFSRWEDTIGPGELERAVLSLLDFGQIAAAKQLQHKLSPGNVPPEFIIVDAAIKLAELSTPVQEIPSSSLEEDLCSVIQSYNIPIADRLVDPEQVLENLCAILAEGSGRGLCKRIIAVVKAANVMGISFSEAFHKQPAELLQLLSLKAQDSFEEAKLLLQTHSLPAKSIAKILAESFLKGLLAAHRGGYIDSQKEEGPAPLLWRFSDFLKWAELCPSEPEVGHALMRLVITGQEIPHECEVELLILSHHFYKSSACLDGVDVLVALAATRVEAYVVEGDFSCLARLITGVGNFHALNFILGILIENGQLDLLLHKYSTATDGNTNAAEAVRGFRMAVLTSLKHFSPNDLDAFAMVYNHFDMKHETASLLESRAEQASWQWFQRYYKYQNDDLLESMRFYIEAAEVHSSIDAGNKTRAACARASLVSLQIRMPDIKWLNLSETNARRALVEQSQFQEALIVAEAYDLNQPGEWALVLWNQMLKPELVEAFVAEFVAVLPLQPSMLLELARFYRAEVAARGDQSQFSVWVSGGGLPAEWAKYLGRSFRCLLKRTRDLRLRSQLASVATGFVDVINSCNKALDKVPENAGPLVLRKGHGGAYLPLM